jgi:hypothetical protein
MVCGNHLLFSFLINSFQEKIMSKLANKLMSLGMVVGLGLALVFAPMIASAWEPRKPVEFIVMAGKGGGADKAVRFMQNIISKHSKLLNFTAVRFIIQKLCEHLKPSTTK